jgi:hypothetical protein
VILGGMTGVFTLTLLNGGLVSPASPGSILAQHIREVDFMDAAEEVDNSRTARRLFGTATTKEHTCSLVVAVPNSLRAVRLLSTSSAASMKSTSRMC